MDHDELLINPIDAKLYHVADNQTVKLRSRNGETRLKAKISEEVKVGVVFTTFHFPDVAINQLTSCVLDQDATTPEFKVTAVAITPAHT